MPSGETLVPVYAELPTDCCRFHAITRVRCAAAWHGAGSQVLLAVGTAPALFVCRQQGVTGNQKATYKMEIKETLFQRERGS